MSQATQALEIESLPGERSCNTELQHPTPSWLPATALGSFHAGIESLNSGDAKAAAVCFEQALSGAPEFADAHIGLGIAYAIDSRVYPALDHLENAAKLEPGNFYAHFKLGQLYFKLRVPQKGYEQADRALACASSLEERKLVAQLLREERQQEKNGVMRPRWNKPFPKSSVYLGVALLAGLGAALLLSLR